MKTLIVLPETDEDVEDVGRAIQLSADRFSGRGEITFAAPQDTIFMKVANVFSWTVMSISPCLCSAMRLSVGLACSCVP